MLVGQPLFEGEPIDAGDGADPAEQAAERDCRQDRVHALSQAAARGVVENVAGPRPVAQERRHPAEVGEAADESARAILRLAAGPGAVPHGGFHDTVARAGHEHRDEAVHVEAEGEAAGHVAAKHLEAAVVVMQPQAGHPAHDQVEDPRWKRLVPGV